MALELIYTSAPNTLDGPGYGVVAKSEGLPRTLEKFLLQFNRYDFDLSLNQGTSSASPVVYSHVPFREASKIWHVMSRVGPGGMDYTNRWVFLAHHVAVAGDELQGAGVGELMRNPALFQSTWDGRIGTIPPRSLPATTTGPQGGPVWNVVAGHRDWARIWVERYPRKTANPSFIVVPVEADVLGLFTEAMALLPPNEARQVSFLTQMIADRDGVNFDWIGLTAGSKLARDAMTRFPARTLDLTTPMAAPPASVPRLSQTSKATPRGAATSTVRRRPSPVNDAEDFDEYKGADARPVSRRRSNRRDRDSDAPPPPPPPPPPTRLFDNWYVAPLLFMAGIAVTAVIGKAAWKFGAIGPAQSKADVAPQAASAEAEKNPVPPTFPVPTPAVAQGTPTPDPKKTTLAVLPSPPAPAPRSSVLRLKGWLSDMLSKAEKGAWVQVLEIEQKDIPPSPYLRLLVSKGSSLESRQMTRGQGADVIDVSSKGEKASSVQLRLRDGHVLEILRAATLDQDLLNRLAYCVLEIRSSLEDPKTPQNVFGTARVIFTPALREVPFFPSEWAIGADLDAGANAFFRLTDKLQQTLQARIRVHRITLSFLPGEETGWKIHSPDNPGESPLRKEFVRPLELELPDGRWPVALHVTTHFDRGEQTTSPIETQLVDPHPPGAEKTDKKDVPIDSKSTFIDDSFDQRTGRARAQVNRGRKPKDAKRPDQRQDDDREQSVMEQRLQETGKRDSHAFILELFRRFGRLHGSIVVSVQNGTSEEDVEILRFTKAPVSASP